MGMCCLPWVLNMNRRVSFLQIAYKLRPPQLSPSSSSVTLKPGDVAHQYLVPHAASLLMPPCLSGEEITSQKDYD